jgi:imidazolonepropionase-like amidohydrolase
MRIALVGGTVIDGTGASASAKTTVVIEGSKIAEVTQQTQFSQDVKVFDVSGKTVMPGLIDTHVHFGVWFQWLISQQAVPLSYLMAKTALHMRRALETGVTTARDLGGLEVGFVQAQSDGLIPGPRLHTGLVIIQATNGLTDIMPGVGGTITPQGLTAFLPGLPSPWADGVAGVRAKVREVLRFGAQVVKVANNAVPWSKTYLRPDRPLFTLEEMEAIVDEAHRAGAKVCCHVVGYESTQATIEALKAGVDLLDHAPLLDDECIEEMVKRKTWYCPMFSIIEFHAHRNPDLSVRPIAAKAFELTRESFRKALEAGVRVCMGTDQAIETGWQGNEMAIMAENGMTPMQSIVTSTLAGAQCMGMDGLVGSLEVGKEADLLVVDGETLKDLRTLADPKNLFLVMQAGKPVSGPLAAEFSYQVPENLNLLPVRPTKRAW